MARFQGEREGSRVKLGERRDVGLVWGLAETKAKADGCVKVARGWACDAINRLELTWIWRKGGRGFGGRERGIGFERVGKILLVAVTKGRPSWMVLVREVCDGGREWRICQ